MQPTAGDAAAAAHGGDVAVVAGIADDDSDNMVAAGAADGGIDAEGVAGDGGGVAGAGAEEFVFGGRGAAPWEMSAVAEVAVAAAVAVAVDAAGVEVEVADGAHKRHAGGFVVVVGGTSLVSFGGASYAGTSALVD